MLHSFTKIYIHLIWSTKARERLLSQDVRSMVGQHILEYAKAKDIKILSINIQIEHVHVLVSLLSLRISFVQNLVGNEGMVPFQLALHMLRQ